MTDTPFYGPLFIYGMGRSGTSYLRRLTNSIPGVFLLYESRIIKKSHDILQTTDILANRKNFQTFLDTLKSGENNPTKLFAQPAEFYDRLYEGFNKHRDFSKYCEELFRGSLEKGVIWGDKLIHQEEMRLLLQIYPDAKFIIIVRDVRSVAYSIHSTTKENYLTTALMWADNVRFIRSIQETNHNHKILIIRYEDLVHRSVEYLKKIAIFIQKSPPDNYSMANTAHAKSIEKWRNNINPSVVRQIEEICFNEMRHFGYEPEFAEGPKKINQLQFILSLVLHMKDRLLTHRRGVRALFNYKALRKYLKAYSDTPSEKELF